MSTKILIIDDDKELAFGINAMLKRAGFHTKVAYDGYEGIKTAKSFDPDLIICDVMMPELNGFEVLKKLSDAQKNSATPFIFLTARTATADKFHGFREGADDYITKPFLSEELLLRIEALLRRKKITTQQTNDELQAKISNLQLELRNLYSQNTVSDDFIEGLVNMLRLRDNETEEHSRRVLELSQKFGLALGMQGTRLNHLRWGAVLHDIGKVAIPDHILNKPGELTDEERVTMQEHAAYGYSLLAPLNLPQTVMHIPHYHHEKWDGSGYPDGLQGTNIPLEARMFAIVDVWDALTSDRPYRSAWSHEKAIMYLIREKGKHFDPALVDIFLEIL
jgi:putative two-component system response regulator